MAVPVIDVTLLLQNLSTNVGSEKSKSQMLTRKRMNQKYDFFLTKYLFTIKLNP